MRIRNQICYYYYVLVNWNILTVIPKYFFDITAASSKTN